MSCNCCSTITKQKEKLKQKQLTEVVWKFFGRFLVWGLLLVFVVFLQVALKVVVRFAAKVTETTTQVLCFISNFTSLLIYYCKQIFDYLKPLSTWPLKFYAAPQDKVSNLKLRQKVFFIQFAAAVVNHPHLTRIFLFCTIWHRWWKILFLVEKFYFSEHNDNGRQQKQHCQHLATVLFKLIQKCCQR